MKSIRIHQFRFGRINILNLLDQREGAFDCTVQIWSGWTSDGFGDVTRYFDIRIYPMIIF